MEEVRDKREGMAHDSALNLWKPRVNAGAAVVSLVLPSWQLRSSWQLPPGGGHADHPCVTTRPVGTSQKSFLNLWIKADNIIKQCFYQRL